MGTFALMVRPLGLTEVINNLSLGKKRQSFTQPLGWRELIPSRDDLRCSLMPTLRGTGLGGMLGILPGAGPAISSFAAYAVEKRIAKHPERFGKGAIEGLTAPEGANNAAAQTSFIPTLSLGVPGDATMALMLGALKDFAHIGMIGETPYVVVVNANSPVKSVQDLIDLASRKPGVLNHGSAGVGSTTHLATEMFKTAAGVNIEHIPYESNAAATTALMGGEIDVLIGSLPAVLAQIRAGSIRALGVGTLRRSPQLPEIPTVQEAGVAGYRASLWLGLAAPAGVPDGVLARLSSELKAVVEDSGTAEKLSTAGTEPNFMSQVEFRQLIEEELVKYGEIVKGIRK